MNENTKKLFLFKNDFLSAIEAKSAIEAFDNSGNSTGKGVGNPTSNDFAVNAHKARYISLSPRTNSDSALHQSTMTPSQAESFTGGSQDAHQKRGI